MRKVLTEGGTYPQLPTQPKKFQTDIAVYGHPELPREEKSKFAPEEKKVYLVLKVEFSGGFRLLLNACCLIYLTRLLNYDF